MRGDSYRPPRGSCGHGTKHTMKGSNENTFDNQNESDALIEDLEVSLAALREEFHVRAENAGSIVGPVVFGDDGDRVDCARLGKGGYSVPSDEYLRRLIVPNLATWDPQAGAAKRLVAREADLLSGDRANLAPLVEQLVRARLLTRSRDTLEVAHEALLRRKPITDWLEEQKDALKLRDDLLREAMEWANDGKETNDLVRRGERLEAALVLRDDPDFATSLAPAFEYLAACRNQEASATRRTRRTQRAIYGLLSASSSVSSAG